MGHSVTIIAIGKSDFTAFAEATGFRRNGTTRSHGLPPVGYSESRGQPIVWIDRISDNGDDMPDLAEISRAAPFWALTVVEHESYAVLERFEAGEVISSVWNSPGEFPRLRSYGHFPLDLSKIGELNIAYTRDRQDEFGIEQEPSPFTIPILAFRELTGVEYDGADAQSVETAEASFPVEP